VNGITLEDSTTSIEESIGNTRNAISLYSNCLNQAYYANRMIVIDDISSPKRFERLKEMSYIMFSKPHNLLSDIIYWREILKILYLSQYIYEDKLMPFTKTRLAWV
jgi:hypothetical protein